jgi:predicted O-methyltransferase YrrM
LDWTPQNASITPDLRKTPHMTQDQWSDMDAYIVDRLVPADPILEQALLDNHAGGLPSIDVAPNQGKLLHILARVAGAKRILEIGTLGGYSTIWLARALPGDGTLVTLEFSPKHARVARANIDRAGLSHLVTIHVGPALENLPKLAAEAPFDLIFVDADKRNNPNYLDWALKLSRPGTLIIVDNVVRDGAVLDASSSDADIRGIRRFFDALAHETGLTATALQTVGTKGWDGLAIAIRH